MKRRTRTTKLQKLQKEAEKVFRANWTPRKDELKLIENVADNYVESLGDVAVFEIAIENDFGTENEIFDLTPADGIRGEISSNLQDFLYDVLLDLENENDKRDG